MPSIYKTIKYSYFDSDNSDVVIVFPQAMHTSRELKPLVKLLSRVAKVIFIESGYYGITKINTLIQAPLYSSFTFRNNLCELLEKFRYKKLYLVAGSVGAIHALSFLEAYPKKISKVALAAPALYKNRGIIINNFYKLLLQIGYSFYPDKYFSLLTNLFKDDPNLPWLKQTYNNVVAKIGSLSYLLCLKEIVEFTSVKPSQLEKLLSKKANIFLGKNDNVFNLLCDENLCFKAKSCEWIESDHSALLGAKMQIFKLLS